VTQSSYSPGSQHSESTAKNAAQEPSSTPGEVQLLESDREPCPTPLKWHEILQAFLQEANHWYLEGESGRILGRTWGQGPRLYFLNGLSGTHELYSLVVWLLREDYQCILFDYPQTKTSTHKSLAELIPEIARLHADTNPLTIITRDFGLRIVQQAASRSPGSIKRLICQTPHLKLPLSRSERLLAKLGRNVPFKLKRIPGRKTIQQRLHRPWFPPYDPSRFEFYLDNTGEQLTKSVSQRFLLNGTSLPVWPHGAFPERTLLLRTEGETPTQSVAAEELSHLLPATTVEWLHTSGQLAFLTHPHRIAKVIQAFLDADDNAP